MIFSHYGSAAFEIILMLAPMVLDGLDRMTRNGFVFGFMMLLNLACASSRRPVVYADDQRRCDGRNAAAREIDDGMLRTENYIAMRSRARAVMEEASAGLRAGRLLGRAVERMLASGYWRSGSPERAAS